MSPRLLHALVAGARARYRDGWGALVVCSVLAGALATAQAVLEIRAVVLDRPAPYPALREIVHLEMQRRPDHPLRDTPAAGLVSIHEAAELRERGRLTSGFAGWAGGRAYLGTDRAASVRVAGVQEGLLELLGVRPALGTPFSAADHERAPGEAPAAVLLSHRLWTRLGRSPDIAGDRIRWNGAPVRVAGVMPEGFFFPEPDFLAWVPFPELPPTAQNRGSAVPLVGRLRPGVAAAAAADELTSLLRNTGTLADGERLVLTLAADRMTAGVRPILDLLGLSALLLLVVATGAASALRLADSEGAARRAGVRRALGAGWLDEGLAAAGQAFSEALLITLLAAPIAAAFLALARRYAGALPFAEEWTVSARSVGTCLALAFVAAAAARAPLLLRIARSSARLLGPGYGISPLPAFRFASGWLAFGVAAATVLLIATFALGGSAWSLTSGRGSFSGAQLAKLTVDFRAGAPPPGGDERVELLKQVASRLESLPAVEAAGYADALPDGNPTVTFRRGSPGTERNRIRVSPGFLGLLGLPVSAGREFLPDDVFGERVAVISRALALTLEGEPLGQTIHDRGFERRVVGVAADVLRFPGRVGPPALYVPHDAARRSGLPDRPVEVVARLVGRPSPELLAGLGRVVAGADSRLRVLRSESVRGQRLRLLGSGALAAVLIAVLGAVAIGLSFVSAWWGIAEQAARERYSIAVRQAVGAEPADIAWEVSRNSLASSLAGMALGSAGGWLLMRFAASHLPWVETGDWLILVGSPALLGPVLLAACGWSVRRHARAAPWRSLRQL